MGESNKMMKIGRHAFDATGIYALPFKRLLGEWDQLCQASIAYEKRAGGLGYWLELEFNQGEAIRVWSTHGVKNLRNLADVLRIIRSSVGGFRLSEECLHILDAEESFNFELMGQSKLSESDRLAIARVLLVALDCRGVLAQCRRLRKASSDFQEEALRIEIQALLLRKRFGSARRRLNAFRAKFPESKDVLIEYTYSSLSLKRRSSVQLALELLNSQTDGSVCIGIKLASLYMESEAFKEALAILNILGDWPYEKSPEEILEISRLRKEAINSIEYKENVCGMLRRKHFFGVLPTLVSLIVLGVWVSMPAIKQAPSLLDEAVEMVKLDTWGVRAKQVVIKTTVESPGSGMVRVYYRFATGFAKNKSGRIVAADWKSGSSLLTKTRAKQMLADPKSQYVQYDVNNVTKNQIGAATPLRVLSIFNPSFQKAKIQYIVMIAVTLLALLPLILLCASMARSLFYKVANALGPKPKAVGA